MIWNLDLESENIAGYTKRFHLAHINIPHAMVPSTKSTKTKQPFARRVFPFQGFKIEFPDIDGFTRGARSCPHFLP
ncbi:predicted protein [Plenodomus lingam JN3]|uniref:Predicted protein n=1 Tax=Leptosphaeria maculans (strain JN3 / isolate v23.1.3 / race Av1-4-5-6-7-8) TaxID=985895 RepID=E5A060_LEPMJ|nr:predicted protein [Plenodomus lingam JN3]CBX96920.1 predicted protein [Plenodomus lingam JN3]